ncbi:hypothetical protein [Rhodococcus sp. AG1013]|uniref:hypothetical protein n=1 Tax=Rhodococcus sp. AG1013 TaxID=2183996 RepID=UPI0011C02B58|nr:hypothetical protein [Rhodococcus sp. AG1013]
MRPVGARGFPSSGTPLRPAVYQHLQRGEALLGEQFGGGGLHRLRQQLGVLGAMSVIGVLAS